MKGHTLVIPRREVDYYFDMTDEEIAEKKKMKKINGDDTMNSLENLLAEGGRKKEVQE